MEHPSRWMAWLAVILAALLVGTSCAADDPEGRLAAVQQRQGRGGWTAFLNLDHNRDRLGDVLWFDPSTGRTTMWLMNGTRILAPGPVLPGPGEGWTLAPSGDFNDDGLRDLLWNNVRTNRFVVWLLNGTRVLAPGPETPGPPGDGWDTCFGTDFNGDEMADVLWNNPTRNCFAVWLMNGTQVLARGPEIPGPGGGWVMATAGEFDHDGLPDVLWHNPTTNRFAVWLMNGTRLVERGPEIPGPGAGWRVIPCGDFDGDGLTDVLWNEPTTNQFAVWLMSGPQVLARGPAIAGPPGDGWHLVPSGDANGDGMSDLLWDNPTTNRFTVWLMNGAHLLAPGPELPGPSD